jgi:hypothetical protein
MRHYVGTWPQSVEDMDVYSSGRDGRFDYLHRPPSLPSIPSANQIYRPSRQPRQPRFPSANQIYRPRRLPSLPSANQIYRPSRQPRPVSPVRQSDLPSSPSLPSANQIYRLGPVTDFAYPPRLHDATPKIDNRQGDDPVQRHHSAKRVVLGQPAHRYQAQNPQLSTTLLEPNHLSLAR